MKQHPEKLYHTTLNTPLGKLEIVVTEKGVLQIILPNGKNKCTHPISELAEDYYLCQFTREELSAYFSGRLKQFTVPIDLRTTAFRARVLMEVNRIPYGETASYKEIAELMDKPHAIRAVGGANAHNPLPVIIPCHRVIAHNGTLGGYGGGLEMKKFLLRLEGAL
ncbi:MAG: methylated-DNA--[protein]-cysteine S-methyltransferase [Fidelibacterota bacterium]